MAKLKILKEGETDINSTNIWRFALHSDYKCQKLSSNSSVNITLPAGSSSLNGDFAEAVIPHGLGYIPVFFAFVEYGGKGYEAVGNSNPQIQLTSSDSYNVGAGFNIYADENNLNITVFPTDFGTTANNETFIIRAFFIEDEIL